VNVARQTASAGGVSTRVVALLALAVFINYIDRGNLATAAPLVRAEFSLSNTQLGLLLSAFFWSYAPGQLPAGWIAERLDARLVLAWGLALWGTATVLAGFATGFVTLLVLRVILGCGESVMFPASFKILACEASDSQRGRVNGFLSSGLHFGSAFGTLVGGLLMARFGWRAFFIVAGFASLLWLWPWLRTPRSAAAHLTRGYHASPLTSTLLHTRELWGSCVGAFCGAYALYSVLSWLPVYLVRERGFSMAEMSPISSGAYLIAALSSVLTGWVCDRRLTAGISGNFVRKTAMIVAFGGLAVCLSACAWAGDLGLLLALGGWGASLGIKTAGLYACVQTLSGPGAAARWMGVQNFCANIAGITAPIITGVVVDRTGSFALAFLIAAGLAVVGLLAFGLIVRRVEPIDWSTKSASRLNHPDSKCAEGTGPAPRR
jgi:MFS family permease